MCRRLPRCTKRPGSPTSGTTWPVNGDYSAVYPGVIEGLEALQAAGLRLVCLTNKPAAFARPLLQAKGLGGFFEAVFGGDAFERKKPDPLPLLKSCEALGRRPLAR